MSLEYYISFEPISAGRMDILEQVLEILHRMEAQIDKDFDRLELSNGKFEYSYDELESPSLVHAATLTEHWDGVEAHFVYRSKLCSLLLLNDIPKKTTLVLSEPASLFEKQQTDDVTRTEFLQILDYSIDILEAGFCIFEPEWVSRSRTLADINRWLSDVARGVPRDWEMVIVKNELIPPENVPTAVHETYDFQIFRNEAEWMLAKKS